jgi:hypothetical protein
MGVRRVPGSFAALRMTAGTNNSREKNNGNYNCNGENNSNGKNNSKNKCNDNSTSRSPSGMTTK